MQNSPSEPNVPNADFAAVPVHPAAGPRGDIHLYLPEGDTAVPYILGIHGGGWRSGDQSAYAWLWPKVRPLGIGLALASYRLAPEHRFPTAFDDLVAVLAWLQRDGERHRLDPGRCLLFGGSAGGHLAMLLAARATAEGISSPRLRGVASYCGIMDLRAQHRWDADRSSPMTHDFLGGSPADEAARYDSASPLENVHAAMPPVWLAHGSADAVVPAAQAHAMAARLRALGHDPVHLEARGLGHTMIETSEAGNPAEPFEMLFEQDFLRFVRRTLLR